MINRIGEQIVAPRTSGKTTKAILKAVNAVIHDEWERVFYLTNKKYPALHISSKLAKVFAALGINERGRVFVERVDTPYRFRGFDMRNSLFIFDECSGESILDFLGEHAPPTNYETYIVNSKETL